ncbi:MAG: AraC family transcriptional regulator [Gemmatimonadetes bacterium]|nr:AraC family transcriptional regulator [Gemmatimonadota bacterium]
MGPITVEDCPIREFSPPYERFGEGVDRILGSSEPPPGSALVWWLIDGQRQGSDFERLRSRPPGVPLVVLLPPAREISRTLPLLNYVMALHPRSVLPAVYLGTPEHVRLVLSTPPGSVAEAVTRYLGRRGLFRTRGIEREIRRIFELAPEVPSITKLARRMYTSRRTLGRHFAAADLPVPSHWLQFARLLHVCLHLQSDESAIFRIATRLGYPDGFTMSNQMKRLLGYRPSEIREYLGWEWIVETWLRREGVSAASAR